MLDNVSKTTKILMGATLAGAALTIVSAIKDVRDNKCCCIDECDDCCEALADPTVEMNI